ncbi:hypothetical protein LCGC14_1763650 [marine sediment metagenome]|uniref:LamG-like jellyroll fold domain-containing protein n=1 Tax=marine sediment metagenome TaxID=412755 RepID=A0A0F9JZZ0_9ZZZZ
MGARSVSPSFANGFAPRDGLSANPGLWDGLVGAWVPSLGVTGLTLFDVSRGSNNGTLTSMDPATDWVMSEKGWALDFDGSDDNVLLPTDGGLLNVLRTAPHSFVLNFKSRSLSGNQRIFAHSETSAGLRQNVLWTQASAIGFTWDPSTGKAGKSTSFTDTSEWHSLIGVLEDSATISAYLDGVPMTGTTSRGSPDGLTYLGQSAGGTARFNGQIGVFLIYSRILTFPEIQTLYVDPLAPFRLARRTLVGVAAAPGGTILPQMMQLSS